MFARETTQKTREAICLWCSNSFLQSCEVFKTIFQSLAVHCVRWVLAHFSGALVSLPSLFGGSEVLIFVQ